VPLVLANARLNEASWSKALRWPTLSRPAYAGLSQVCAQAEADALRLRELGAPAHGVWGNLKFDATPNPSQLALARAWRSSGVSGWPSTVMLASSREGEELLFLKAIQALHADGGDGTDRTPGRVQWLLVPRHPQRFDELARLIEEQGFACLRRSAWGDSGPDLAIATEGNRPVVWLGDSLGEMALYYALADVALLGGSFAPFGGQNLIEAAACACPLVLGPHTHNFADAADHALAAGAAARVADMATGVNTALGWVNNPLERSRAADAGLAFAQAHKGAAARMADEVARWATGRSGKPAGISG